MRTLQLDPKNDASDYDRCMGMFALLGATSAFGELPLKVAVPILHGALKTGCFRIYLGDNGRPSAGLVWAFLDDAHVEIYLKRGYLPSLDAWNSGDQLWLLHIIAQGGTLKAVMKDGMSGRLFPDQDRAFMLRPGRGGRRRIVELTRTGARLVRVLMPEPAPAES